MEQKAGRGEAQTMTPQERALLERYHRFLGSLHFCVCTRVDDERRWAPLAGLEHGLIKAFDAWLEQEQPPHDDD
jgi:hypothetical protein